eukprot:Gb_22964 [translate_table: standard]
MEAPVPLKSQGISAMIEDESPAMKISEDGSSTPKLAIFSSPWEIQEPQGVKTPPLRAPVSIPFKWEEIPGKPKPGSLELAPSRSLHLPPRLLVLIDDNQSSPGRGFESPSKHSKSFRISSYKHRSTSRHEFDSPVIHTPGHQKGIWQSHEGFIHNGSKAVNMKGEVGIDSPISIFNGPQGARSRGTSSSSQDSASVLADTLTLTGNQDDAAPAQQQIDQAHQQTSLNTNMDTLKKKSTGQRMRDLVAQWTMALIWQNRRIQHKKKKVYMESDMGAPAGIMPKCFLPKDLKDGYRYDTQAPRSSTSSDKAFLEDKDENICKVQNIPDIKTVVYAAGDGLNGKMPPLCSPHCSPSAGLAAFSHGGNVVKKRRRRRWVFRKMKRSSTLFVAIWKRLRSALSLKRRKMAKPAIL